MFDRIIANSALYAGREKNPSGPYQSKKFINNKEFGKFYFKRSASSVIITSGNPWVRGKDN
jgi:hypothetical protein